MTDSAQPQITDDLLDQACEWVVRLRAENVASGDLEQFSDWVTRSDGHRSAFEQIAEMWGDLGVASSLPVDELPSPEPTPQQPRFGHWFSWRTLGGVAAVTVVAVVVLLATVSSPPELDSYRTAVGEHLQITLDDGSQVDLNTNSELEVRFEDDQRWLHLVRGEAYFSVARDKERPFVVELNGATAKALGTEFNIYKVSDSSVHITVTEGTVQVIEANSLRLPKILEVDQAVTYSAKKGLQSIRTVDKADTIIAWRQRQIVFDDTPLPQVVSTLNRYSETPIELGFRDSSHLTISGTFSTERPIETARAMAEVLALTADIKGSRLLLQKNRDRI